MPLWGVNAIVRGKCHCGGQMPLWWANARKSLLYMALSVQVLKVLIQELEALDKNKKTL